MKPLPPRWRLVLQTLFGVVAAYGLIGIFIAPLVAKKVIADKLGERLGRVVIVDDVSVNPYTLSATLKGFRILEPDGKTAFASFEVLDIDGSIASVYRLAPVVDELTLTGVKVNLVRDSETHYNVSDILGRLAASAQAEQAAQAARKGGAEDKPSRFSVGNIRIVNAAIDFDDRPKGTKHRVSEVQVAIPFVSNLPVYLKDQVQPSFSANVNGAPLRLQGEVQPFENTLRTHFTLDVRSVDVRRYLEYSPTPLPVKVDSGKLDAKVSLRFTQAPGKDPTVDITGTASLGDLALSTADGALAKVARLEADIASLDPIGGKVRVSSLRARGASAMEGQWNIPSAEARTIDVDLKKHSASIASLATSEGVLAIKRGRDGAIEVPRIPPSENPTHWDIALARLDATRYKVTVVDAAVKPAATHRVVLTSLEAEGLTTAGGLKGAMSAKVRLDKSGSLDVSSTFALEPLAVNAKLDARAIDLVPLRPYATQFRTVQLKSGAVSAKGNIALQGKEGGVQVKYAGTAEIANFATADTLNHEDLLNFKAVKASGVDLEWSPSAPLTLAVADIVVDKVYSRIVVNPDGKLNLQQLRSATPEEPDAAPQPPPRNMRIDRITFVDGRLDFTDHYIKPNYAADVRELQGTVTNLSSETSSRAVVDLKGSYDGSAPVIIAGTVNPLSGDLFLDIGAKSQGIELARLSAYSTRYAGYGITAGKLSLDVKYHVENGKLEGRNVILIDQLTFGDKVEGPDATTLPVLFAVNLLKDSKGIINLELPISGSLEDPKFDIGSLITQVVSNLFKRALTSPFSLIAAAAGGGGNGGARGADDLAYVEFEPGVAELSPAGQEKLGTLVKALLDRPAIRIEVASRLDPVKDREALAAAAMQRRLDALPKDMPAAARDAAREKLAKEPIVVSDEELKALALRRGEVVRSYLAASGRLPAERVLVAAAPAAAAEGSKARLSRVDFALK